MDQQTKAALKQDKFVTTTTHGLEWASQNRHSVIVTSAIVLAVILVLVIAGVVYNSRSTAASAAFGNAMQTYQTPLAQPGQPVPPGVKTFPSAAERAKAANAQFLQVADKYGMMPDGKNALYFAGPDHDGSRAEPAGGGHAEEGRRTHGTAIWRRWRKFSLAGLYRTTGRDQQAIDLLKQLSNKPTTTVPAGLAKLQLADLYEAQGKTAEARNVYAKLKDKDAKGVAGGDRSREAEPTAPAGPLMPPQL